MIIKFCRSPLHACAGKNRKQTIITLEIQPPPSSTDCAYSILRNWLHSISTVTSSTHRAADIQRTFLFLEQNCSNGASNGAFIALLLVIRILARFFTLVIENWTLAPSFFPKKRRSLFLKEDSLQDLLLNSNNWRKLSKKLCAGDKIYPIDTSLNGDDLAE